MTIAGILSACSYNRLYFRAKKAMDSLAVKLFKSSIFSYHFLIVVEILALCNFFLEEKMCHFGQTDCFLKNSSKFVSDFTKSRCENSFTGGSVDKVHRNRAQAPVSKYLFGLISNIFNCTDTFCTCLGPGKLSQ